MKNLVTGGAGFIGSNLIRRLLKNEEDVICLDNFITSKEDNIKELYSKPNFKLIEKDIKEIIKIDHKVDRIWHLASPASPSFYQKEPLETTKTIFMGTLNMLELAKNNNSRILLASTSEIYGKQKNKDLDEKCLGLVNPIGPRSCYGEAKRLAESISFDYLRKYSTNISIVRIFNTYGPYMHPKDGRVISNFIMQALGSKSLSIYGEGSQRRSFCYIDDIVEGLIKLMNSTITGPLNLGNPFEEYCIKNIGEIIKNKINPNLNFKYLPLTEDEPLIRKPNILLARNLLNWNPKINLDKGLELTIDYFINQK